MNRREDLAVGMRCKSESWLGGWGKIVKGPMDRESRWRDGVEEVVRELWIGGKLL